MRVLFGGTIDPMFAHELVRAHGICGGPFAEGDGGEAARLLGLAREIHARFPRSSYAQFVLGTAHYRAGQYDDAARLLEGALGANDWPVRLLGQPVLAMANHRLGRPDAARRHLDEAAATLGRWADARYSRGTSLSADGRRAAPVWPASWWDVLELELWHREARLTIDGAAPGGDPRLLSLRGRALMDVRRPEQAVGEYAAALALSPHDPQIRLESRQARASAEIRRGNWAAAGAELAAATELGGDDVRLWRDRALANLAAGDREGYRAACAAMLARFGDTADPVVACNVLHASVTGAAATDELQRLVRLADLAATCWHYGTWTQGAALYRAGRYDDAVRSFRSASETYRPRAWDWCFLAMAHLKLGHTTEARRCLAEAARWVEAADSNVGADLTSTRPAWGDWQEPPTYRLLLKEAADVLGDDRPLDKGSASSLFRLRDGAGAMVLNLESQI
jgi:tetratricopeptide (TPR) repeat protein